jgi:hypothetical protein
MDEIVATIAATVITKDETYKGKEETVKAWEETCIA